MTLDRFAIIMANSFEALEKNLRAEFTSLLGGVDNKVGRLEDRIGKLEERLDYRFNALSNRIDDLALNRTTRNEHKLLEKRVSNIEKNLGLAN